MKKVAIQGTLGSYHDIAAHKYFEGEEIQLICCASFEDVFAAVKQDSQTIGMLAIENTIAGSLLHNNELLRQSGTQIVGEYKLRISHSFVCLPDEDWDDITEVNSHPIALMQCREFLGQHPRIKVVEGEDTALSAEIIRKENLRGHAAICSKAAAERYGMKVLQEGIETNKHNFTRFLVVADPWQVDEAEPPPQQGSEQGKHGIHVAAYRGKPFASIVHPVFLPHQPDKDTVTAHHRARMGISILCRRSFRQCAEV